MLIYLLIALGGALDSMARYAVGVWFITLTGLLFPWSTLLIARWRPAVLPVAWREFRHPACHATGRCDTGAVRQFLV
jgi:hypothetical protein